MTIGARDDQRSKVYKWERDFLFKSDEISFHDIQSYVNYVWQDMGLKYPPMVQEMPAQATTKGGDATRTVVRFPRYGSRKAVVLHELAHSMTGNIGGMSHRHGEKFVGVYMGLLEKYLNIPMPLLWYTAERDGVKYEKYAKPILVQ